MRRYLIEILILENFNSHPADAIQIDSMILVQRKHCNTIMNTMLS